LCAAENAISAFCKIPLAGNFQERYIMGNTYSFDKLDNFIGSEYLYPFYSMVHDLCHTLYGSKYADCRTLTGMNCMTTVLMALTKIGDNIAILPNKWGGHPSVWAICERLGLRVSNIFFDAANYDIDYEQTNKALDENNIDFILLAPSDIIFPFDVGKLNLHNRILLYDASQILGLIAGKQVDCPLNVCDRIVLFGGTHKTLPGPSCGLILTNSDEIHVRLEKSINPLYLRHTQMQQVVSLLFALLEMKHFGNQYAKTIIHTSNELGRLLQGTGFEVLKRNNAYSSTHQLFIKTDPESSKNMVKNGYRFGISLNGKDKELFNGTGIRIGTQEIARYDWGSEALETIAIILAAIKATDPDEKRILRMKKSLPSKKIHYTFNKDVINNILCNISS
jgi:glycine/serine hydroxymethyltransferase